VADESRVEGKEETGVTSNREADESKEEGDKPCRIQGFARKEGADESNGEGDKPDGS
jgi:hypothetical protein